MRDPETPAAGDDFHAELSDVRSPAGAPSPHDARRTPLQRLSRLAVLVAAGLVMAALVVSNVPAVGESARALLARLGPAPAPIIVPGSDLFDLLPNPPGTDVVLDGRVLAHVPMPGDGYPLRLARGTHVFVWRSHGFPFTPLRCAVSVPHAASDSCPLTSTEVLMPGGVHLLGFIIMMHVSLAALDPRNATALVQVMQAALDARRSTAEVLPGEQYFSYHQGEVGAPVVAQQPLRATLGYQLDTRPGYPEPCTLGRPAIPCRFPGQDCTQLCTITSLPPSLAGAGNAWYVAAIASATWDYATVGGQHVALATHIGERFGVQLAVLRLTWDGSQWQATLIFGHTPGLDAAEDIVCDPARFALSQTPSWNFMVENPPPGAQVRFIAGAAPTDGCVVLLDQAPGSGHAAVFLQRFGVLLTVNDEARNPVDNLPVADATEQRLAQQLLDQAQP
ncbi:MAG: hypothetical protein PVSMB4_09170 [Ktedonobacterales bacterium]